MGLISEQRPRRRECAKKAAKRVDFGCILMKVDARCVGSDGATKRRRRESERRRDTRQRRAGRCVIPRKSGTFWDIPGHRYRQRWVRSGHLAVDGRGGALVQADKTARRARKRRRDRQGKMGLDLTLRGCPE